MSLIYFEVRANRKKSWSDDQARTRRLPDAAASALLYRVGVLVTPEKGNGMRVLIADSHDQVRSALQLLLEQENSVEATSEAPDRPSLLASAERFRADVLLLDWGLAGAEAEQLLAELRERLPALRIIALSSRPEDRRAAVDAGISQFVSKNAFSEELLAAVRGVGSAAEPRIPTPHDP